MIQQIRNQTQNDPKNIDPELVKKVNTLIEEAVGFARSAISIDNTNYYNYLAEARVSELALSFQIPNAYDNLRQSYINAIFYNPWNPSLYLSLAKIEVNQGKTNDAINYIGNALQLKQNYVDAIYELGLIYYNNKNYENSAQAFSRAIEINPQYANARYFLGLSLARLNKTLEAIEQFSIIQKTNPDNQEIGQILTILKTGKTIFADNVTNTSQKNISSGTNLNKKVNQVKTNTATTTKTSQ